jgi:RNA polymerase sigma factor (sigma-70 family)
MQQLLRYLRSAIPAPALADVPDRELLSRFARSRDEVSFAALVGRHGGAVWATCRRLVDRDQDAEDAFQAVFLTLARKAASIRRGDALPCWLHGVARRIAANLRRDGRRRARAETEAAKRPLSPAADLTWQEGLSVLDEELGRLPERYQAALIVCCLEGRSRDEAAAQLGWSPGQVKGRLERARDMLGRRLARRGFDLAGSLLAVAVARSPSAGATAPLSGAALAGAPPSLVSATVKAAALVAAREVTTAAAASAQVALLTEGVLHAMFIEKVKVMAAVLLAIAIAGGGLLTYRTALSGTASLARVRHGAGAAGTERDVPPAQQAQAQRPLRTSELNGQLLRDLGNRFDVEVIGQTKGVVSGTEVYFYDSDLATAAVHAGLVQPGEKAILTVTVVKCPTRGVGSTQHGVTSLPWEDARAGDTALVLARRSAKGVAAQAGGVEGQIDVDGAGHTAMEIVKTTKDADAKWMALRILGNLRYERAVPLLLAALADPHPYVRSNAARALGDMKVAAAAKPLTEMLKGEENGGVIQQTSLALGNLHHTDALPVLKRAAKHHDVQTRMWVLQAVGRLGGKRDVAFLARYLLDDPSSSVQMAAAQSIEHITGADFGFPRRSGPSSPDEGLRRARAWWAEHKGEY